MKGRILWNSNLFHLLPSSSLFPPKRLPWVIFFVEDRQCFDDDAIATVEFTLCRESYILRLLLMIVSCVVVVYLAFSQPLFLLRKSFVRDSAPSIEGTPRLLSLHNKKFRSSGIFLLIKSISMGNVKDIIQVGGEGNLFHYLHYC